MIYQKKNTHTHFENGFSVNSDALEYDLDDELVLMNMNENKGKKPHNISCKNENYLFQATGKVGKLIKYLYIIIVCVCVCVGDSDKVRNSASMLQ